MSKIDQGSCRNSLPCAEANMAERNDSRALIEHRLMLFQHPLF